MPSIRRIMLGLTVLMLVPTMAQAYFTPEDVLLSKEFFLPPSKREADSRIARQLKDSKERREAEQELIFSLQQPEDTLTQPSDITDQLTDDEVLKPAAPEQPILSQQDQDILRTVHLIQDREDRLIDRVYANQNVLQHLSAGGIQLGPNGEILHGGAPLAPTGAGGILTAITMVGAVGYTLWRAKKGEAAVWMRRSL